MDSQPSQQKPLPWLRRADVHLSYRSGLLIVLLVALLTRIPTPFSQFSTDDYLIRAMVAGDAELYSHGFAKADPDKPFWQRLGDGFHFYHPDAGTLNFYQHYGNLSWWSSDDAKMVPWRPLSAFTHWIDFQIAPDNFAFQALHSLLYVLLMALCCYRLFWRLRPSPGLVVLASLLLIVDFSHLLNFSWIAARNVFIAMALGCLALERFLAWREGSRSALYVSLLAFIAGLFSAENSLSVLAYMGAYALFVERGTLLRRGLLLMPYLTIVVVWRGVYNMLGYGADGIGLYQDPGGNLLGFLESLLRIMPVILASMVTTLDGTVTTLAPELRIWLTVVSAIILLVCLRLIWPLVRSDAAVRFMLLGSVLAAVPASAHLYGGPRASVFASIGFFWLLAIWLRYLALSPGWRLPRFLMMGAVALHLAIPILMGFLTTSQLLPVVYVDDGRFSSVEKPLRAAGETPALVFVNTPAPHKEFYLPFEWKYRYGVLPDRLNLLAPGMVSLELTRISNRAFELEAPVGLPLHHLHEVNDLKGRHPWVSSAFAGQILQALMTSPEEPLRKGDRRHAGDLRITVLALNEDRPSRLLVEFTGDTTPDQMVWQYYDWQEREYRVMPVPAIGKTVSFPGPFDTKAGNLLNLCVGCEEGIEAQEKAEAREKADAGH